MKRYNIEFDDIVIDEDGQKWTQLCLDHQLQLQKENHIRLSEGGSGTCGVKGCQKEADYYLDFWN